jgi:hypothetical protein
MKVGYLSVINSSCNRGVDTNGLSTSVVWSGIGDDNKINASEMLATTLSGTVAIIGTVTSINGNVKYLIKSN